MEKLGRALISKPEPSPLWIRQGEFLIEHAERLRRSERSQTTDLEDQWVPMEIISSINLGSSASEWPKFPVVAGIFGQKIQKS